MLKLSRCCTERSITKNNPIQVTRHKRNIFKNSLMMYLVMMVKAIPLELVIGCRRNSEHQVFEWRLTKWRLGAGQKIFQQPASDWLARVE